MARDGTQKGLTYMYVHLHVHCTCLLSANGPADVGRPTAKDLQIAKMYCYWKVRNIQ